VKLFKSIAAILVGFFVSALLATITDLALETTGVISSPAEGLFIPWMIVLVIFYRSAYTVLSGFVVAKLAPSRPMLHAMILGIIGVALTLVGTHTIAVGKAPLWFGYSLAILALPSLWLGVKIAMNYQKMSYQ